MLEVTSLAKKYEIQNISSEDIKFFEKFFESEGENSNSRSNLVPGDPRGEEHDKFYKGFTCIYMHEMKFCIDP